MKKILLILLLFIFFINVPTVFAANSGTLTPICQYDINGKPVPGLRAVWNLDENIQSPYQCNIYIRTPIGDWPISTQCKSGLWVSEGGRFLDKSNNTKEDIIDGGNYILYASTGNPKQGGGWIEEIIPLEKKQYCERFPDQPLNSVDAAFGKIEPPVFIKSIGEGEEGINSILNVVVVLIYVIAANVFIFMILWAAFQWITSGGEKEKLTAARQRLTHAIIGIVILALAGVIITTVGKIVGFSFFF